MKTNIVYISKKQIIGIDYTIPLLMELKERYSHFNFIILLHDLEQKKTVKENYHIWEAIEKLHAKIKIIRYNNRLYTYLSLLIIFLNLIFQKNIIIKNNFSGYF